MGGWLGGVGEARCREAAVESGECGGGGGGGAGGVEEAGGGCGIGPIELEPGEVEVGEGSELASLGSGEWPESMVMIDRYSHCHASWFCWRACFYQRKPGELAITICIQAQKSDAAKSIKSK